MSFANPGASLRCCVFPGFAPVLNPGYEPAASGHAVLRTNPTITPKISSAPSGRMTG
jgi:hypothetical protein